MKKKKNKIKDTSKSENDLYNAKSCSSSGIFDGDRLRANCCFLSSGDHLLNEDNNIDDRDQSLIMETMFMI